MKKIVQLFIALSLLLGSHLVIADVININTADAQTIAASITGVGEKKALAIVAFRDEHGPFESVDDMTQVKGIGHKLVNKNRDRLSIKNK